MRKILLSISLLIYALTVFSQTFSSTDTPLNIPDNNSTGVTSVITVSGINPTAEIESVKINSLTHSYVGDLTLELHYYTNVYTLSNKRGSNGDNYTNTRFIATASTSITTGSAPFTGDFLPEDDLPIFEDGTFNPNGDWQLVIIDDDFGASGTIDDWEITFKEPDCPTIDFSDEDNWIMTCDSAIDKMQVNGLVTAGGSAYSTLYFQFYGTANNAAFSNTITIYEDGSAIWSGSVNDLTRLTVYSTGPYFSPASNYTIDIDVAHGSVDYLIFDGNGSIPSPSNPGTVSSNTHNIGPWSPMGSGTWSISSGTLASDDRGYAAFDPAANGVGTYDVTYSWDNQGTGAYLCTGSATHTITVNNPHSAAWTAPNPMCLDAASIDLNGSVTGDAGGTWSGPGMSGSTFSPSAAGAGTHSITYTYDPAGGCELSVSHNIVVHPLPTVNPITNAPVCEGDNLTLNETGGALGASWVWTSTSSWNPNDIQSPNQASALVSSTGNYTVSVTDGNSCTNSATIAVVVNDLPAVNPITNAPVCEGDILTLNETGGALGASWVWTSTSSWNPADIQNPNQASSLTSSTGIYTVSVTDGNNCTNTATVSVTVDDIPEVSAGSDATICADQTYTLSGSFGGGASSVLWTTSGDGSFDDATSTTATYTPGSGDIPAVGASSNNITLTLTTDDPAGSCGAISSTMTLTIDPMEDASFSYSSGTYCNTASDPSPTITGDAGTFSAPSALSINASTGVIDVSASTIGGPYTVTYTTSGTCSSSSTFDITITAGADAEFSYSTPICSSSANPLPSHSTGSNGTYSSTAGLVFVNTGTGEIDLLASAPGSYTITNNVDLGACGSDIKTFDITIDQAAEVFAGNDLTVCESDGSYVLSTATQGGSTSSVTWSGGTGSFTNGSSINATYNFGSELGAVTLTVTTNNPAGVCPAVADDIILTINDAAEVNAGTDATICADGTYNLSGTSGGSTSNITWSTSGDGTFVNINSLTTAVYTPGVNDISNGIVNITISSDNPAGPCDVVSDFMVLTINPLPTVVAGSNSPICDGQALNLTGSANNISSWVWDGPEDPADIQNPTISSATLASAGTYTVTVTDGNSCSNTASVSVLVNALPNVVAGSNSPICSGDQLNLAEEIGEADSWTWTSTTSYDPADIRNPFNTNALPVESGTYTVVGEITSTGCTAQSQVVVTINDLPTVTADADDNSVCEGTQVTLTGYGADTYTWSPVVTDGVPFTPSVGTVTYTVTGTNSTTTCSNTADIDVTVYLMPTADAGMDATICEGESYTLNASIGGGASSASWTSSSGDGVFDDNTSLTANYTPSTTDIANGVVTLTLITDDPIGDCDAAVSSIDLTITPLEDANFTYSSGTFCITGTNPVPTSIVTTGGTFSGSTGLIINATTGEIDLTGTGIGGPFTVTYVTPGTCFNSSTYDITITSGFDAEFFYDTPVCNNGTNPLPQHNTGSNGNYSSTAGLDFVNVGTGEIDFSTSLPGSYTITNTIAASGGCSSAQATFDITIDEAASVSAGIDDLVCESDGTYILSNATMGGSASSVTWTTTGSGTFTDANLLNAEYNLSTSDVGTTIWMYIQTDDPGTSCSFAIDSMQLTIDQAPIVDAGLTDSICAGETYMLNGSFAGSTSNIIWSTYGDGTFNDENSLTAIYTPGTADLSANQVYLYITSDNPMGACSSVEDSVLLKIHNLPQLSLQLSQPLCEGLDVTLSETQGEVDTWDWTADNGFTSNIQNPIIVEATVDTSAWYVLTGTNSLTACSFTDSIFVQINALPSVYAGADQSIPAGNSTAINDATPLGMSYNWTPSGLLVDNTVLNPVTQNLTSTTEFILEVTDPTSNCSNTDTMMVTILGCYLDTNQIVEPLCYMGSDGYIRITLETGMSNYDFYLSQGGSVIDSQTGLSNSEYTFNGLSSGDYQVLAIDGTGCRDSLDITIGSPTELSVSIDVDSLRCWNNSTGKINTVASGSTSPYYYNWEGPDNFTSNLDTIILLETGEYNLTVTDFHGCTTSIEKISVREPNEPGVTMGIQNQSQCYGFATGVITSVGQGGTVPYSYSWTNGIWTKNSNEIDSLIAGDYHLVITDANNCDIADSIVTLREYSEIELLDSVVYQGTRGTIYLTALGGTPAYEYTWMDSELEQVSTDSYADNLITGTYMVTVSDFYGCSVSASYEVEVPFVIPTLITPNNDGYNDTWQIAGIESYDDIFIEIYNRWGNVIYTYSGSGYDYGDVSNQFDGTYNGSDLPIGAYVYILDLKNGKEAYHGTLNIVRIK